MQPSATYIDEDGNVQTAYPTDRVTITYKHQVRVTPAYKQIQELPLEGQTCELKNQQSLALSGFVDDEIHCEDRPQVVYLTQVEESQKVCFVNTTHSGATLVQCVTSKPDLIIPFKTEMMIKGCIIVKPE